MGRLFWKFLFSYWAALLLAVLGVEAAVWLYQLAAQGRGFSIEAGPRAAIIVGSAAATLRHGGLPALRALMEDWGCHGNVLLFAVDGHGRDLLGRPVDADALARARMLVEAGEEPEVARRVRLQDGETYLLYIPTGAEPWQERLLFRGRPPSPIVPLAAATLASLIFGVLLAWYVARPIRYLRSAFASLSQGRLETRVAPLMGRRRDEVADLGRDFDRMAQKLQNLIAAQRSLLHEVSHELRSPLARLQAAIGLVRQNPQKLHSSLERIEQEAERLDELIGELLTLSRLDSSVDEASCRGVEPTDLVDLVASIAADSHFEAQTAGRAVVFSSQGEAVADVCAGLLHRAVENVVRNAVKYTRPGTTVEVNATRSASSEVFTVSVADRGPGVEEGELRAIFEPFYRGATGQPGPGFGLGLAIARRAVEVHGGRVHARNRDGGGLVIEMCLPLGRRGSS
ncbi:MAG: ATP-binding protein [Acidobacteriota bacterium]